MKHCAESYSVLQLSQWSSEAVAIAILQKNQSSKMHQTPTAEFCRFLTNTTLWTSLYPGGMGWRSFNGDGEMTVVLKQIHVFAGQGAGAALEVPSVCGHEAAHLTPAVSSCCPPSKGYW